MAENVIAPLGNFASLSYLKEDSKLRLLIDVCTMFAGALVSLTACYICYHIKFRRRKKKIKSLSYRKIANYLNYSYGLHIVNKFFWSKITASCVVMYVTLIRLPFKHETCDQYHLLFS